VNTSGGSPAAISDSSLASPVALGMLDSVTWMSGWVASNLLTIWLSSVSVFPDHIVCQVMFTTPPGDEDELPPEEAAGPPQAVTARAAHAARASPALRDRDAYIFSTTRCSFPRVCIKCLPRGSDRTRAAATVAQRSA
jgi:hypothetical protein